MTVDSLLLFGARSGTGLHLARLALSRGWTVTAAIRPAADAAELAGLGCEILFVDVMDAAATASAVAAARNRGAVVSTLGGVPGGPAVDDQGNIHVIDAARAAGIGRLLLVSSLGAGNSRAFASPRLVAAIGSILDAKSRAEAHLRARLPRHVILRPGALTDDFASGEGALYTAPDVHGSLSRADLAALILRCLAGDAASGHTLSAVDRTRRADETPAQEFDPDAP
jgi:Putative NADH-flavin reductase